jgi:hypothetical protein
MIEIIAALFIGMVLGVVLAILYIAYQFKTVLNELDTYIEKAMDDSLLGIRVEKHGAVYRFYRAQDNQYLCQTTTVDNICELFKEQFPTKTVYIEDGDEEAVKEIKQILVKGPL